MTTIRVETVIAAVPTDVWEQLRRIERHVDWMQDAETIRFTTDIREGVGTGFECDTRIGILRLTDRMEITTWLEPREMRVRHTGLVRGDGRFVLEAIGDAQTRFVWEETLHFPFWMGGRIGGLVGAPILARVWRANLAALAAQFEPEG